MFEVKIYYFFKNIHTWFNDENCKPIGQQISVGGFSQLKYLVTI